MTRKETDRNVLFGVLAWQMGVVDREMVMAAMFDCTTDGGRSLPEVLESRGQISPDDRSRLEQIVAKQLQRHDNDVSRTLSDLSAVDELRSRLDEISSGVHRPTVDAADPIVDPSGKTYDSHHTVDAGRTMRIGDRGPVETQTSASQSASPPRPKSAQRFRVVRNHARGGLGEVLVAVDDELNREVALKQILSKHADNRTSRSRFLLEAEITGKLEHPGVVPVYGLGSQADGRPYYAMRFIRGESLEDAIVRFHDRGFRGHRDPGRRALELRQLLTRFMAVCNTIEYAHSRGIVHRDIKPENIMLGPYGETLVVDWGLARPFTQSGIDAETELELEGDSPELAGPQITAQSAERPTQMGAVVGTPQFMSPEQASGRIDLMSRASDVYSLGATLYCLLTSEPPFTSNDVRRVLAEVQKGQFPPPRSVAGDVPRGLEAICLKAMALKPADRYASAGALADDIEHWLADEPVTALDETGFERLQRWMRRHRTWTRAAAVVLVLVAAVAGTAYAREAKLRAQEEQARREADEARQTAEFERGRAEEERMRSDAHARRAEEQSALALSTLRSVLNDIQAKLKFVPSAQSARLSMLTSVIDGLKKVARNLSTAGETDRSMVKAHLDLGDIFLQAGTSDAAGATALAEEQFKRALALAENLAADADDAATKADLGTAYQRLGDVELQRGDARAAVAWLQKSLERRSEIVANDAKNFTAARELGAGIQRLGIARERLGETSAAADDYRRFLEICERLVGEEPGNFENQRNLAVAYERMGDIRLAAGDAEEAERYFVKCLEARRRLVEQDKANLVARRDLSVTLDRLADLARDDRNLEQADEYLHESVALRMGLYGVDPHSIQTMSDLTASYARLGDLSGERGKWSEAAEYYRYFHRFALLLSDSDPGNVEFQLGLATACDRLAVDALRRDKEQEAKTYRDQQSAVLEKLTASDTASARVLRVAALAGRDSGELNLRLGDVSAARGNYLRNLELVRRLAALELADQAAKQLLAEGLAEAGVLLVTVGETEQAGKFFQEATTLAEELVAADGRNVALLNFAAQAAGHQATQAWEARRIDLAEAGYRRTIERVRRLAKAAPESQADCNRWIAALEELAAGCEAAKKAAGDLEFALAQDKAAVPELLDIRAARLIGEKKFDEATATLEKLASLDAKSGDNLFLAARRFAALAPAASSSAAADRAMRLLEQAYDVGFYHSREAAAKLEFADELATLRTRDEYKKLLEKVRIDAATKTAKPVEGRTT